MNEENDKISKEQFCEDCGIPLDSVLEFESEVEGLSDEGICGCLVRSGNGSQGRARYRLSKSCTFWINTSKDGRITSRARLSLVAGQFVELKPNQGFSC